MGIGALSLNRESGVPLYIRLYEYYRERVISGAVPSGSKLPSIRRCAAELELSKTTVEAAYLQLAAEGYIISKPGSGFYAAELSAYSGQRQGDEGAKAQSRAEKKVLYDFASSSVDRESFDFALWRRYMKSALRDDERLLSYGEPQGEFDLRQAVCFYVSKNRGVVCDPSRVVIGSGVQTLLYILCAAADLSGKAAFTGFRFEKGEAVLRDMGLKAELYPDFPDIGALRRDRVDVVYISPSNINELGDVLPVAARLELLSFAAESGALIIEDDHDSEFRYYGRPVPSLQGLDSGENVVYLGTFSKLLLPSMRVSFMVLPSRLIDGYEKIKNLYSQTASVAEQLALCRFMRDGHLESQARRVRKLYMNKSRSLCAAADKVFGSAARADSGGGGFLVRLDIKTEKSSDELKKLALSAGVAVRSVFETEDRGLKTAVLSCSGVPSSELEKGLIVLKNAWLG